MSKINNSLLSNNQMASSGVIESGIFYVTTTQKGTDPDQSAYTSVNVPVRWTKNVDEVTLVFTSDSVSRNVVANNVRYTGMPAHLKPNDQQVFDIILGSDNSHGEYLVVGIRATDGQIVMGVGGNGGSPSTFNHFTAGNVTAGPYAFSITYYTGSPIIPHA